MKRLVRFNEKIGQVTETGLALRDGLTFKEWTDVGAQLQRIEKAALWWIGDWLNYGERAYGEMYSQALDASDYSLSTLQSAKYVASRIESCRRLQHVSWSIHQEVAGLPPAQQAEVLAAAATKSLTVREVRERVNALKRGIRPAPPLPPEGQFSVILADPPWRYDFSPTDSRKIENQYPTMEVREICELGPHVPFADNAVLFLWATAPKLREALEVVSAWGFDYVTHGIWDKEVIGMGYWFRGQHEPVLVATRGTFAPPAPDLRVSSVIRSKRAAHSEKPENVYRYIEAAYPEHQKLEMFARGAREGWTPWGNEVGSDG